MEIFRVDDSLKSYKYTIIKISVCLVLLVLSINADNVIAIDNRIIDILAGILGSAMGIASLYCIILSFCELSLIHENREKDRIMDGTSSLTRGKDYAYDQIVTMAKGNDIIDIWVLKNGKVIQIGSSSDCKNGGSEFFGKRYYIGKREFESIEEFESSLLPYSDHGQISVFSIDGTRAE